MEANVWYGFEWFGIKVTDWALAAFTLAGVIYALKGYFRLIKDNENQRRQTNIQQFETTFFKLLDNHRLLVRNFDFNDSGIAKLITWSNNLKALNVAYKNAMNTHIIVGQPLFNFNPCFNEFLD